LFSGVFLAEEVDGVGDKGPGETTTSNVETQLEGFVNISLRFACFNDNLFFWEKAKLLVLELLSSSARLSDFQIVRHQIKGIMLFFFTFVTIFMFDQHDQLTSRNKHHKNS
jgi:hypothetical protein